MTHTSQKKALLVYITNPLDPSDYDDQAEFEALALAAEFEIATSLSFKCKQFHIKHLLGKGQIEMIHTACLSNTVDVVIFNRPVTPSQERI